MRSGVGYPSYGSLGLTWTAVTGSWSTSAPLTNVADLTTPRLQAIAAAAGSRSIAFALPSTVNVSLVALIHHNLIAGDTIRLRLFSDAGRTVTVFDQTFTIANLVAAYPAVMPMLLSSGSTTISQACISGQLDITTSQTLQIGGIEVAGFYGWYDTDKTRSLGFNAQGQRVAQPGGTDANMRQWSPRSMVGQRDLVDRSEMDSTWLDFQMAMKTSIPFIWLYNGDDPTSWARECFLAKNKTINLAVATADPAGVVQFTFEEHLG